jgi:hypothetical protein
METDKTYRVLKLVAENYKRLKAADVTPGRNAVTIKGKNKAGKTSLLDAIAAALGGKKQMAEVPLRKGAESGQIVCVLGDTQPELLVKRVFDSKGKTMLEITSAEGYKAPTPQAILDSLCTSITFDPLSFIRMTGKEQVEMLKSLMGLDFTVLDEQRKKLYDERTDTNRLAKSLEVQAAAVPVPSDAPTAEVSVADLLAEQTSCRNVNRANQTERERVKYLEQDIRVLTRDLEGAARRRAETEEKLATFIREVEAAQHAFDNAKSLLDAQKQTVAVLQDADENAVAEKIKSAQSINDAVARRKQRDDLAAKAASAREKATTQTAAIDAIDAKKEAELSSVKWPIEGLGFDDSGVSYNGLPLSQASGAEQLEIGFSITSAMRPQLKVALIRDASLLDADQMKAVTELAERYDMQIWLEVVSDGPGGILIEDGTYPAVKPDSPHDPDAQPVADQQDLPF